MFNSGTATLTNCTLSGDSAWPAAVCTTLARRYSAELHHQRQLGQATAAACTTGHGDVHDCTISGNSGSGAGGGVYNSWHGDAHQHDRRRQYRAFIGASDIIGTVSGSYNLIGTGGSGGLINGQTATSS